MCMLGVVLKMENVKFELDQEKKSWKLITVMKHYYEFLRYNDERILENIPVSK